MKITDCKSFQDAVSPHLELTRFMNKSTLSKRVTSSAGLEEAAEYEVQGNVLIHPSAKVGRGCIIGPNVVIGADCELQEGVRLKSSTLLPGACIQANTLVSGSLIGWTSQIGKWCQVHDSIFGESVEVFDSLLVRGATVLPNKELKASIRTPQIVI